jgi:acetyl esterase
VETLKMNIGNEHGIPLWTGDIWIAGYSKEIRVRVYVPQSGGTKLPLVLFFHGGGFISGSVDDSELTATALAERIPALVMSVGYSLAPEFPFPAALEDGYLALAWAVQNAKTLGITPAGLGIVGYEAGGNLATCLSALVRDRGEFKLSAQVLLAPLLDPSMTLISESLVSSSADPESSNRSRQYRAYLPDIRHRLHPYAAPLVSVRLGGLAPAFIATVKNDMLRIEAERYATKLIAAGVPTAVIRYEQEFRRSIGTIEQVLQDMAFFFRRRLVADQKSLLVMAEKLHISPAVCCVLCEPKAFSVI